MVAVLAVPDDGEGFAPVALAAEEPVAELVVHLALAVAFFLEPGSHLLLGFRHAQAVEVLGVHHGAVVSAEVLPGSIGGIRLHYLDDGQFKLGGELEVAAVVSGHGHDGAGTVAGEHVVSNPDGNLLAIYRVGGIGAGEYAGLLLAQLGAFQVALGGAFCLVGFHSGLLLSGGDGGYQLVLGGKHHVGGAEKGIGAGGVHGDGVALAVEVHFGTGGLANPVALEELDALRPVERFEFVDKALGIGGDAQHPLAELAALHDVALALPFLGFFVGEHGAHVGAPVHHALCHVGQAHVVNLFAGPALGFQLAHGAGLLELLVVVGVVEAQENPLCPAYIAGVGGGYLAVPVVGEAQHLELAAEIVDVLVGRDARVLACLDGVLLCGETEGVPAHGVQHVEAVHALVTAYDIGGGVALRVAYMQTGTTRVGEHIQDVALGLAGIKTLLAGVEHFEGLLCIPGGLPLGFKDVERIRIFTFGHVARDYDTRATENQAFCACGDAIRP